MPAHGDQDNNTRITGSNAAELRQIDEFLMRADKVAAVGQLASGVAHEIRNPLVAIQWNLRTLMEKHPDDAETYEVILSELSRIDSTVEQLLSLARSKTVQRIPVDLVDMIGSIVRLMQVQATNTGVNLDFDPSNVPPVTCDVNQLKQVFVNLLVNALDAMPDGGTVTISMRSEDTRVQVRVADTGVGITAEDLARIGEPFFTTKPNGTGLGLMTSRKIVEEHGGRMEISSQPGQGTTIVIELPCQPTSQAK